MGQWVLRHMPDATRVNQGRRVAAEKSNLALIASLKADKPPIWSHLDQHTPGPKHYRRANTRLVIGERPKFSATPDPDATALGLQRRERALLQQTAHKKLSANLGGHLKDKDHDMTFATPFPEGFNDSAQTTPSISRFAIRIL